MVFLVRLSGLAFTTSPVASLLHEIGLLVFELPGPSASVGSDSDYFGSDSVNSWVASSIAD